MYRNLREGKMTKRFRDLMSMAMVFVVSLTMAWGHSRPAQGADHRDGPLISNTATTTGNLDVNDLFLFVSPTNANNTVLILTTGGNGVGFITPPIFAPGSLYQFRIDNTGDIADNIVFSFVFSDPDQFLRQRYSMFRTDMATDQTRLVAQGTTGGRPATLRGGGRVTAGIFDDPFFFDSLAFPIFLSVVDRGASAGMPNPGPLAERAAAFTGIPFRTSPIVAIQTPRFPVNAFGNTNTLAIVLEIPRFNIQSSRNNPNINVWIRSTLPDGSQFDRTAIPAVNTTIVPPPTAFPLGTFDPMFGPQEIFNQLSVPQTDVFFREMVSQRIQFAYGASPATADQLAMTLLPDIMPFNTTSRAGFNDGLTLTLNGRRLADDVVDAELNALTEGALSSDRVVNDSVFQRNFPYIGSPLPIRFTR
ncbi:hypothetical protein BH23PLA1_BH23PLA1_11800 [soil metagenome]